MSNLKQPAAGNNSGNREAIVLAASQLDPLAGTGFVVEWQMPGEDAPADARPVANLANGAAAEIVAPLPEPVNPGRPPQDAALLRATAELYFDPSKNVWAYKYPNDPELRDEVHLLEVIYAAERARDAAAAEAGALKVAEAEAAAMATAIRADAEATAETIAIGGGQNSETAYSVVPIVPNVLAIDWYAVAILLVFLAPPTLAVVAVGYLLR